MSEESILELEDPDWDPLRSGIILFCVAFEYLNESENLKFVLTEQVVDDSLRIVKGLLLRTNNLCWCVTWIYLHSGHTGTW